MDYEFSVLNIKTQTFKNVYSFELEREEKETEDRQTLQEDLASHLSMIFAMTENL